MAGAILGEVQVSPFVAGTVLGDVRGGHLPAAPRTVNEVFICDEDSVCESFCVTGAVFSEVGS